MTPGLLEHAKGNYKSEWDAPISNSDDLPPVPDYEEIMIWDKKPGARSGDDDDMNPSDGAVGDFNHPDFWESVDGGDADTERNNWLADSGLSGSDSIRQIGITIAIIYIS